MLPAAGSIEQAEWLWDEEPTVLRALRSRHEAHALALPRQSLARGGRLPPLPRGTTPDREERGCVRARARRSRLSRSSRRSRRSTSAGRAPTASGTAARSIWARSPERKRIGASRTSSPRRSRRLSHPESGEPAFDVRRKEELYHGFYFDKAPGARAPSARRAHPRRLFTPALERGVPAPRAPLRARHGALLRPARSHGHPGRRRARNRRRGSAAGLRDHADSGHDSRPPRPRGHARRAGDRGDPTPPPRPARRSAGLADARRATRYTQEEER